MISPSSDTLQYNRRDARQSSSSVIASAFDFCRRAGCLSPFAPPAYHAGNGQSMVPASRLLRQNAEGDFIPCCSCMNDAFVRPCNISGVRRQTVEGFLIEQNGSPSFSPPVKMRQPYGCLR